MYEQIFFAQEEAAEEAIEMLRSEGPKATIDFLSKRHDPGTHAEEEYSSSGNSDDYFYFDGYKLSWNLSLPYIGLEYKEREED